MEKACLANLMANYKIGSKTIIKLNKRFGNLSNLYKNKSLRPEIYKLLNEKLAQEVVKQLDKDPNLELERLKRLGINFITYKEEDYPKMLLEIPDKPAGLYYLGNIKVLNNICISIVGTRKYSLYGKRVTLDITSVLARYAVIVSGLALGIDTLAHTMAVKEGGLTCGVLACGLDMIYPRSNFALAKQIVESGGVIISENPPGTQPFKTNFPIRNRIIAGLSIATVVMEAAKKSGTLLTAKAAMDYNREVFAVPGSIYSEVSEGANNLIKYGAYLAQSGDDIIGELNIFEKTRQEEVKKIVADNSIEAKIMKFLEKENPTHIDKLAKITEIDISMLNTNLVLMEMKGKIKNLGANLYVLK